MVGGLAGYLEDTQAETDSKAANGRAEQESSQNDRVQQEELFYWGIGTTNPDGWGNFTDQTGINVNYTAAPWRPGQIATKMVQGSAATDFDIAGNDVTLTRLLDEQGAIRPTDLQELSNWEHVYQELKESKWTQVDGEPHTLSSVQNGDSVAYLPEHVGDPNSVNSYGILFDEEFQGKTALESGWATAYHKVANYLQYNNLAEFESIERPTQADVDKVIDFLMEHKQAGQFRTFWSGWQSAVNLLAKEEVWAMDTWEPVVFALREDDIEAEYLWPEEGFSLWAIGPWMTRGGAQKEEQVNQFVNWMMDGWYNAQITSIRGYLTSSDRGIEYAKENDEFDAEFIENRHETVREKFRMEESVHGDRFPETFSYLNEQWNRLTS